MLEALASIDWHQLYHAYGSADDVPDLLRALLSPDPHERSRAHKALYASVLHQGTVYSATTAAVPILLELLADASTPDRGWILAYLANIAESLIEWRQSDPDVFDGPQPEWPAYEAHQAVRQGLPLFLRLLNESDAEVRHGAAVALASLCDDAPDSVDALRARLNVEQNQWVRAAIQFALADLTPDRAARRALLAAALAAEPGEGARLQLAMRLVEEHGDEAPDEALACVIRAIPDVTRWSIQLASRAETQTGPDSAIAAQESAAATRARDIWNELARLEMLDELYPNLRSLADTLWRIEARRIQAALPPLLAALRAVEASPAPVFFEVESMAKALSHIAFAAAEQTTTGQPHPLETLTREQRETLAVLTESDTLWRHGGATVRRLLQPLGVPLERDALRRFLTR